MQPFSSIGWVSTTATSSSRWLEPIMHGLGVHTFADLKITTDDDPGMSLPVSRRYGLVVHTADITRGQLVRLPWDYDYYGQDPDEPGRGRTPCAPRCPSRSSSSPSPFTAQPADVEMPSPGGRLVRTAPRWGHGDVGRRGHVAQLPHRRLRPGGRWPAALADDRDEAVLAADLSSPDARSRVHLRRGAAAACTP